MIPYPVIMGAAQGLLLDPQQLSNAVVLLKQSGLTQIQLDFALNATGDITGYTSEVMDDYGNIQSNSICPLIITNGMYVYSSRLPSLLLSLTSGTPSITTISARIVNWQNLAIIKSNLANTTSERRFINTLLERNFRVFRNTFSDISIIDLEISQYNSASPDQQSALLAFILMLNSLNFGITFSLNADLGNGTTNPKEFAVFFKDVVTAVNTEIAYAQNVNSALPIFRGLNPNLVKSLNPIYDIGDPFGGINPLEWAQAINHNSSHIPNFSTNGFILPGFFAIGCPNGSKTEGDPASLVQRKIKNFSKDDCVGGGFFRTIDHVIVAADTNNTLADYANALYMGLDEIRFEIQYHRHPQDYTLNFVPVNGVECSASTTNYAFCSDVFTIEVLENGNLATALPLKLDITTGIFNIFPQPVQQLNPTIGWTASNNKFTNKGLNVSVEIEYTLGSILTFKMASA